MLVFFSRIHVNRICIYIYIYITMTVRFVSLGCVSTSISFDIYTVIVVYNNLSFQPTYTNKRTTREAMQPIIFKAPTPSSHLFPSACLRARLCARLQQRQKFSRSIHAYVSFFSFFSRCDDEAQKTSWCSAFSPLSQATSK